MDHDKLLSCLVVVARYLDLESMVALHETCHDLRAIFRPSAEDLSTMCSPEVLCPILEQFSSLESKFRLISAMRAVLPEFDYEQFARDAYLRHGYMSPLPINAPIAWDIISAAAERGSMTTDNIGELCKVLANSGPTERSIIDAVVASGWPCVVLVFAGPYALSDATLIATVNADGGYYDDVYAIAKSYAETHSQCSAAVFTAIMRTSVGIEFCPLLDSCITPAELALVELSTPAVYQEQLLLCELGAPVTAEILPMLVAKYSSKDTLSRMMERTSEALLPEALCCAIHNRDIDAICVIAEWTDVDGRIALFTLDEYELMDDSLNITGNDYISMARCVRALLKRAETADTGVVLSELLAEILGAIDWMTY